MPNEILFGAIAIQEGLITPAQLEEALARQLAAQPPPLLGSILVERGFLTPAKVETVLDIQRINIADRVESPEAGGLFGQIAVAAGYLTAAQVNECVRRQQELATQGNPTMIGQVLLQKGYLKYDQFIEILARQEKYSVRCVGCNSHYLIEGLGIGTKFLCRKCLRVLTVPAFSSSAAQRASALAREERGSPPQRISGRAGESFGPYVVDTELGRGPRHVVFKARHRERERLVAMRVLLPIGSDSVPAIVERLQNGAVTARGIEHPNIIPLFDAGEIDGFPFVAHDFVPGETLGRIMMRRSRPLPEIVGLLETTARALHHAHRQGVIHGDLRPSCIFIDSSGAPRISDMSLPGLRGGPNEGEAVIMPYYRSPEAIQGGAVPLDGRADIYSLGAILFEMIAGKAPFTGSTPQEVAKAVLHKSPPRPTSLRPEAPADLETVCLRALEKRPAARPASAADFADDLGRWLAGRPVAATRPSGAGRWFRGLLGAFRR